MRHAVGACAPRVVAFDLLQVVGELGPVLGIDVHRRVDVGIHRLLQERRVEMARIEDDSFIRPLAGPSQGRPCAPSGAATSERVIDSRSREGTRASATRRAPDRGAIRRHRRAGTIRDEMHDAARALLPADHREVRLVAVEPRQEHDAGLVEARRRREDVARQRHRGREDRVEARAIARGERGQRRRRRRRDRVEDAEQRVGVAASRRRRSAPRS